MAIPALQIMSVLLFNQLQWAGKVNFNIIYSGANSQVQCWSRKGPKEFGDRLKLMANC